VRLLPNQVFKINKRWQLGNSPVALRVNYECPLDRLGNPFHAPARLMIRSGPDLLHAAAVAARSVDLGSWRTLHFMHLCHFVLWMILYRHKPDAEIAQRPSIALLLVARPWNNCCMFRLRRAAAGT
jgi:hypothetical protein